LISFSYRDVSSHELFPFFCFGAKDEMKKRLPSFSSVFDSSEISKMDSPSKEFAGIVDKREQKDCWFGCDLYFPTNCLFEIF